MGKKKKKKNRWDLSMLSFPLSWKGSFFPITTSGVIKVSVSMIELNPAPPERARRSISTPH